MSIFFALIVLSLLLIGGFFARKSSSSTRYVCMNCGLQKVEYIRTLASITYGRQCIYEQTAVSRAIKLTSCPHAWMRYRFGETSGYPLRGVKAHLDGGSPAYMIGFLRQDENFANALLQMPKPTGVWSNLLFAFDANPGLNDSFAEWWQENSPGYRGFSNWCYEVGIFRP